jgi:hypothetical protein
MAQWVPINLDVEAGAFVLPLIDFADKGELAPLPETPKAKDLTDAISGALNTSTDSSFAVGLFGMADTQGKTRWEERSWDFVNTRDTTAKADGGTGYTLRWGVGFRIHVQNSTIDSKLKLTDRMPIAWASELGLSQVSYAIEMFGLSEPAALAWLPTPGVFDAQTVLSLDTNIRDTVAKALLAPDADQKVHPVPLALRFEGAYARLAVNKAVSVIFAVSHIAQNLSKETALARAKGEAGLILEAEVARVYDVWKATGSPSSEAFKQARQTAKTWLDDSEQHAPLSRAISRRYPLEQPPSADSTGSVSGSDYDRIVLRVQSVAGTTAQKLGIGSSNSVDASGDSSKLVYELFLRKALEATNLQNGIASMRGQFSGFRLICSLEHVDSKLTTSFPAVSAASALGLARATFELQTWGLDPKVTAGVLQKSAFSESEFPAVRAALGEAKAQIAKDPSLIRPEVTEFVAGTDYVEHSFPGARLIYLALKHLKKERKAQDAQEAATQLGFEKSHMGAVYAYLWDAPSPSAKPPDEVRDEAVRFLELTEPKG